MRKLAQKRSQLSRQLLPTSTATTQLKSKHGVLLKKLHRKAICPPWAQILQPNQRGSLTILMKPKQHMQHQLQHPHRRIQQRQHQLHKSRLSTTKKYSRKICHKHHKVQQQLPTQSQKRLVRLVCPYELA